MDSLQKSIDIFDNELQDENFKLINFNDLQEGNIVMSITMTNSQKYFDRFGYEEYNMTKIGILIKKNYENYGDSTILQYDNYKKCYTKTHFYSDPLSSGNVAIYQYFHANKN
ncbi:hypothetical protein BMW23_1005 [Bodo saltans virus]|jgi:hypothetical protein|uniref:Uncharacterized protein n=1 Tax=Bodo saltans virus TaxID=2024608 RepID=A0A2H4UVV8_9VIRU|nr:hypothetical protein QJ851_gp0987 [Bodo saltans virus]ATZ81050.1 hypothetical protein BMW23_1005 [Bodo saltans virus]